MAEVEILKILEGVKDPEIPVLSLIDLGVVRRVKSQANGKVVISITPTYSGCPAVKVMKDDIIEALHNEGVESVEVKEVITPAWTTDWITEEGLSKLKAYGIAPPAKVSKNKRALFSSPSVACPACDSSDTSLISEFGSTACKAHYQCKACNEPFDYFKCL